MATPRRIGAAFVVVLLASRAAPGQLPTAPPPHPALEEVVTEYRRLGLPLPPRDAELVRVKWSRTPTTEWYTLGFRLPPSKPHEVRRHLIDLEWREWPDHDSITRVEPTPAALEQVDQWGGGLLCLAVQCQVRGWDGLADAAYPLARRKIERPVFDELRRIAWGYWDAQVLEPGADRAEILRHLRALYEQDKSFHNLVNDFLLSDLALTVAPTRSKPGSVAALIDGLTEYHWVPRTYPDEPFSEYPPVPNEAYWRVVDRGFDAVPALIEHAEDSRLTREKVGRFRNFPGYKMRVGHVVSRILDGLSGGEFSRTNQVSPFHDGVVDPGKALKWWGKAQAIREEKWLLDHVLPARDGERDYPNGPNPVLLRVIRVKYPWHLPRLYRTVIRTREGTESNGLAGEIAVSRLPLAVKVGLLVEGAAQRNPLHHEAARRALARTAIEAVVCRWK